MIRIVFLCFFFLVTSKGEETFCVDRFELNVRVLNFKQNCTLEPLKSSVVPRLYDCASMCLYENHCWMMLVSHMAVKTVQCSLFNTTTCEGGFEDTSENLVAYAITVAKCRRNVTIRAMQRIYGTANISEKFIDRNYFHGAHLALDNRTCCYEDDACAYSTLDDDNNPVKQDMVVWWSLDMKDQHYIDHIEIYGWVGNFSTHSHISIGTHVNMTTNPRCSPSTPTNIHPDAAPKPMTYIPNACQGDKLVGRHLAIFKYVSEGETEFKATAVQLCEVIVYGVKID